jgi:thioredoxin-like negative regulator of GroEL
MTNTYRHEQTPRAFDMVRRTLSTSSRTGASLADLMARMGHSSTRAALIYQHAAQEQDRHIADALSAQITQQRDRARNGHTKQRQRPA